MKYSKKFKLRYLLYISALLVVLYFFWGEKYLFDLRYTPSKPQAVARMLIIANKDAFAKQQIAGLKVAAERLNVDFRVVPSVAVERKFESGHRPVKDRFQQRVLDKFKPDFVLVLDDQQNALLGLPNYMVLSKAPAQYLTLDSSAKPILINKHYMEFDALLPTFNQLADLKKAVEWHGEKIVWFQWDPANPPLDKLIAAHYAPHNSSLYYTRIKRYDDISIVQLPVKARDFVGVYLQEQLLLYNAYFKTPWALVVFKNQKFEYYTNIKARHTNMKHGHVIRNLDGIIADGKQIPDGYYIFIIDDGVHKELDFPVLGFASDKGLVANKKVVLVPDNEAMSGYDELFVMIAKANQQHAWEQKIAKIFWRGTASGLFFHAGDETSYPRLEFMRAVKDADYIDAGFTSFPVTYTKKHKDYLASNFTIAKFVAPADSFKYKYLLDIDGHSCSYERMAWILASNSLLLKHKSEKIQWFYDKLQPYVNYLPIKEDFSDLHGQMLWAESHPEKVQELIKNAHVLAADVFSQASIKEALYNGLLQYHAIVSQPQFR
jgi:hypothetical protein